MSVVIARAFVYDVCCLIVCWCVFVCVSVCLGIWVCVCCVFVCLNVCGFVCAIARLFVSVIVCNPKGVSIRPSYRRLNKQRFPKHRVRKIVKKVLF